MNDLDLPIGFSLNEAGLKPGEKIPATLPQFSTLQLMAKKAAANKKYAHIPKRIADLPDPLYKDEIKPGSPEDLAYPLALQFWTLMLNECGDFIAAALKSKRALYRGAKTRDTSMYVGQPFTKRKTMDTRPIVQQTIDKVLTMAGFTALRSNSIFTTSRRIDAMNYGDTLYVIFPKNGCQFTWSKKYRELYGGTLETILADGLLDTDMVYRSMVDIFMICKNISKRINYGNVYGLETKYKNLKGPKPSYAVVKKLYDTLFKLIVTAPLCNGIYKPIYLTNVPSLKDASKELKSVIDVIKKIQSLKLISVSTEYEIKRLEELLKTAPRWLDTTVTPEKAEKVIALGKLMNTNMASALTSGHEICIASEYYAFALTEKSLRYDQGLYLNPESDSAKKRLSAEVGVHLEYFLLNGGPK